MVFAYFKEKAMDDIRYLGKLDYKIENVGFVSVVRNENFTFEFKKGKKQFSFIYVENGELEYFFKNTGERIHIKKGNLLFVPKKFPYATKYLIDGTKIKIFVFDCHFQDTNRFFKLPFLENTPEISSVFNECSESRSRNSLFLYSKIYELLYVLQKLEQPSEQKYKKIFPAVKEIRRHFSENKKISYYASLCNMSESNFRKLFKEYTSLSPIEFRNRIRIAEVKKMLDSGEYRISEAAYTAGFNNMSFFYEIYEKLKNNG